MTNLHSTSVNTASLIRLWVPAHVQGTFSTLFKAPDTYGVFKFVLEHRRPGWTMLEESVQVPVRPFKHNEYDRFLSPAYPYYVSAFSGMAAFFVLGLVFLYSK